MKKLFLLFATALLWSVSAQAQIVLSSDFFLNPESNVKIKLLDSLSNEPLIMASVYLQPKGDTTIMYFNLTDTSGVAVLDKVARGNYRLTAEFMGYKPYSKEFYFSKPEEELGTVRMIEDAIMLEAAKVTAIGNPIEIKQDTIIYNASMFRTAENAALGELLKKMPGFEVSGNGQVKVNGESVSKITVNGKTFFFDDPTMAVNNLPAKIVDKIKITDLKSDNEKSTGISDMAAQKQKEMDISLKKEYEKGWFGNAKFAAGAPVSPESGDREIPSGGKDFMYNGNLMLSGYNEKDQLTIIANANNVPNTGSNDMVLVIYGDGIGQTGRTRPSGGLTSARQAGANLNTSRIKGMETSVMANYKGTLIESERLSRRTTFMENTPDINSSTAYSDNYDENLADISFELKNINRKKAYIRIAPKVNFISLERTTHNDVETFRSSSPEESASSLLNTSSARNYRESDYFMHRTDAYLTIKDLGKKGRSLTFDACYFLSNDDVRSKEFSTTSYPASDETAIKDLFYKGKENGYGGKLYLTYVEPIGKLWNMSLALKSYLNRNDVTNNAYSRPEESDNFVPGFSDKDKYTVYDNYYSSVSEYKYFKNSGELLAQYRKGSTTVQFGGSAEAVNSENFSKSYGISQTTGEGEYLWNFSPFLRLSHTAESGAFYMVRYTGSSSALSNSQITPAPNISNPTYITVGNIYLEPQFTNSLTLAASYNNKKTFSYFSGSIYFDNYLRSIVNANWIDEEGIQYNVPVNSKKAGNKLSLRGSFSNLPLNEKKSLLLGASLSSSLSVNYSYQNISRTEGMDMDSFNYSQFMEKFWGDASGNKFYSGESGFRESRTTNASVSAFTSLRYKGEFLDVRSSFNATRNILRYSLNDAANMDTWDYYAYLNIQYDTKNRYQFISNMTYQFYSGYTNGYGEPAFKWDIEASRTVKAFTFGIRIKDILNQTTNFSRSYTDNYVEDSYRNVIGRHFLITLSFNFGKMNAGKNRSASNAMINMMM